MKQPRFQTMCLCFLSLSDCLRPSRRGHTKLVLMRTLACTLPPVGSAVAQIRAETQISAQRVVLFCIPDIKLH